VSVKTDLYGTAELRRLRAAAAPHDRTLQILQPHGRRQRPPRKKALATLSQLEVAFGALGTAAVANARWTAISMWLANKRVRISIPNDLEVSRTVVVLMRDADRHRLGLPTLDGKPRTPPALYDLSPDCRHEAELVAAETVAAWEEAGRPFIRSHGIPGAERLLKICTSRSAVAPGKTTPTKDTL
jgi:hypothetical protein